MSYNFDELCTPYYNELLIYATKLTKSKHKAQDVVQDAMVRALKAWKTWEPTPGLSVEASARGWLYRIVTNLFKTEFSSSKNHARILGMDVDYQHGLIPTSLVQIKQELHQATVDNQPDHDYDRLINDVHWGLSKLKPDLADVVRMVYLEERTEQDVAKQLGIPCGTVRSRMARGRAAMARVLATAKEKWSYAYDN